MCWIHYDSIGSKTLNDFSAFNVRLRQHKVNWRYTATYAQDACKTHSLNYLVPHRMSNNSQAPVGYSILCTVSQMQVSGVLWMDRICLIQFQDIYNVLSLVLPQSSLFWLWMQTGSGPYGQSYGEQILCGIVQILNTVKLLCSLFWKKQNVTLCNIRSLQVIQLWSLCFGCLL